jgi:hypothetical protein
MADTPLVFGQTYFNDDVTFFKKATIAGDVEIGGTLTFTQAVTTSGEQVATQSASAVFYPAGTLMLFQQTSAPPGWTKQTTHNNKALRVVTGTVGSGGTTNFTSVFTSRTPAGTVNDTTLSATQLPNHNHAYSAPAGVNSGLVAGAAKGGNGNFNVPSSNAATTGGAGYTAGAHNHGFTGTAMDFDVQYVDLIIASFG